MLQNMRLLSCTGEGRIGGGWQWHSATIMLSVKVNFPDWSPLNRYIWCKSQQKKDQCLPVGIACLALQLAGLLERETESDRGETEREIIHGNFTLPTVSFLKLAFHKKYPSRTLPGEISLQAQRQSQSRRECKRFLHHPLPFSFLFFCQKKIIPFFTPFSFPWQLTSAHICFTAFSFLLCITFWALPSVLHSTIHSP